MSERWTPGPWTVFNSEQIAPANARLGDPAVAIIAVRDEEEQRANARLIAASPALLEAAEHAIEALANMHATAEDYHKQVYISQVRNVLKDAAAKARREGEI